MRQVAFAVVVLGALLAPIAGHAQLTEQDEVFRAHSSGRVLGLGEIRERVGAQVNGELISTELDEGEARRGRYIYRLTFLQKSGAVVRVAVDATNGRILQMDGR